MPFLSFSIPPCCVGDVTKAASCRQVLMDCRIDLFAYAREVEQLLGHRVEVGTEVHPLIRDKVEAESVPL